MWCMISRARLDIMLSCRHHVAKLIRLWGGGVRGRGPVYLFRPWNRGTLQSHGAHRMRSGVESGRRGLGAVMTCVVGPCGVRGLGWDKLR